MRRHPIVAIVLAVSSVIVPLTASAQTRGGPVQFDLSDGALLTADRPITIVPPSFAEHRQGDLFWAPASGAESLVGRLIATDVPLYAPGCQHAQTACSTLAFKVPPGALGTRAEGAGQLVLRSTDGRTVLARKPVYWDPTPPRATFRLPAFNQGKTGVGFPVLVESKDENLTAIKVSWFNLQGFSAGKQIPKLEQHLLGAGISPGGHGACVPVSIAANLRWYKNKMFHVVPDWASDLNLVNLLGFFMGTGTGADGCCTSGTGMHEGTLLYFDWLGLTQGVDYEYENISKGGGFTPEEVFEAFLTGGGVSAGVHNDPSDAFFGHIMAVDDVKLTSDGKALITFMDPNVEPPGSATGVYRTVKLEADGTINWDPNFWGYYTPMSGRVVLDHLHMVRPYLFSGLSSVANKSAATSFLEEGGEVTGRMLPDGRSWAGFFAPPLDSSGPWLLRTEARDAAGNVQYDHQYVTA